LLGAGTQRVQEDIEKLTGIKTLRLDSDRVKKKSELRGLIESIHMKESRIVIGTKLMTKRLGSAGTFSMAAVLNTDTLLSIPDFRSAEKAFQEIMSVIDKIEPNGRVFIQTRMPENYLFKSLKSYDHESFLKEELIRRRDLFYPPFSRLVLIRVVTKKNIAGTLSELVDTRAAEDDDIEILGPHFSKNRQGKNEYKLLLKSGVREKLHAAAESFIEAFKDSRDVKVRVDVDPIEI
jgi:primosomal protein N' (replication factor Y)